MHFLCNTEEKGWILVCPNCVHGLNQITHQSMSPWNTSGAGEEVTWSNEFIWNLIPNNKGDGESEAEKGDKEIRSIWMILYYHEPLKLHPSRNPLNDPTKCSSEFSFKEQSRWDISPLAPFSPSGRVAPGMSRLLCTWMEKYLIKSR